jgi:hypothetical protein
MNFEGTDSNPAPVNSNADWKAMLPMIAITSLTTIALMGIIKRVG